MYLSIYLSIPLFFSSLFISNTNIKRNIINISIGNITINIRASSTDATPEAATKQPPIKNYHHCFNGSTNRISSNKMSIIINSSNNNNNKGV